jgi:hypothetical protein
MCDDNIHCCFSWHCTAQNNVAQALKHNSFIPLHVQDHLFCDACHVNYQYHIHLNTVTNHNQQNDYGGCRKHAGECWSSLSLSEVQSWYVPGRTNRNCSWSLAPHQLSLDSTITVHKLPVPWLRLLVTSRSPCRPEFNPRSAHVGFVVAKVALEQVFSVYCSFPCQHHFTNAAHTFIHGSLTLYNLSN